MACHAKPRTTRHPQGWTCHGRRLLTVMWADLEEGHLPIVIPRWAKDQVMVRPEAVNYHPERFKGGDHLHLVVHPRTRGWDAWRLAVVFAFRGEDAALRYHEMLLRKGR